MTAGETLGVARRYLAGLSDVRFIHAADAVLCSGAVRAHKHCANLAGAVKE